MYRRHRNSVHHSPSRSAAHRCHLCPRLPRRSGHDAVRRLHLCRGQPHRRPRLSAARSKGDGMTARALARPGMKFNAIVGIVVTGTLIVLAVIGPWIAPYDPLKLDLPARLSGPSAIHLLGADEFGRDVLSRLASGARTSAWIAFA